MFGDPLEVEVRRGERGQRPEPQAEEQQADPPRQLSGIAPVHPGHPRRHGHEHRDQQRHLPPLGKTLHKRAGDAVLHTIGGSQAGEDGERWHERRGVGGATGWVRCEVIWVDVDDKQPARRIPDQAAAPRRFAGW